MRDHTFARHRRAGAADGADGLHRRAGAGRSDRAQQPARHLHQFRQPARPLRRSRCRRRCDADGTPFGITLLAPAGTRRGARGARPRVSRRHRLAARRDSAQPQPPLAPLATGAARRRDRARGGRRASLRHAAQRRAQVARRAASSNGPRRRADYRLFALPGTTPPKPGLLRVGAGCGTAIDVEIWALPAEHSGASSRRPAAAVDRHADARRRPRRQGLSGRGRGDARRPRHLRLRRLARLHGAEKVSA